MSWLLPEAAEQHAFEFELKLIETQWELDWQVVPNETVTAVDIEGADVLPAKLIEDEFKDQYGQPLNFARVEKSRHTIDNWYRDRYLDGMVIIFITPNVYILVFPKGCHQVYTSCSAKPVSYGRLWAKDMKTAGMTICTICIYLLLWWIAMNFNLQVSKIFKDLFRPSQDLFRTSQGFASSAYSCLHLKVLTSLQIMIERRQR